MRFVVASRSTSSTSALDLLALASATTVGLVSKVEVPAGWKDGYSTAADARYRAANAKDWGRKNKQASMKAYQNEANLLNAMVLGWNYVVEPQMASSKGPADSYKLLKELKYEGLPANYRMGHEYTVDNLLDLADRLVRPSDAIMMFYRVKNDSCWTRRWNKGQSRSTAHELYKSFKEGSLFDPSKLTGRGPFKSFNALRATLKADTSRLFGDLKAVAVGLMRDPHTPHVTRALLRNAAYRFDLMRIAFLPNFLQAAGQMELLNFLNRYQATFRGVEDDFGSEIPPANLAPPSYTESQLSYRACPQYWEATAAAKDQEPCPKYAEACESPDTEIVTHL